MPCTKVLGDDHGSAGGETYKKVYQQGNDLRIRAAHCRQRLLAHKAAQDYGVYGIVKLLEKRAKENGKEKQQHLLPDDAVQNAVILS